MPHGPDREPERRERIRPFGRAPMMGRPRKAQNAVMEEIPTIPYAPFPLDILNDDASAGTERARGRAEDMALALGRQVMQEIAQDGRIAWRKNERGSIAADERKAFSGQYGLRSPRNQKRIVLDARNRPMRIGMREVMRQEAVAAPDIGNMPGRDFGFDLLERQYGEPETYEDAREKRQRIVCGANGAAPFLVMRAHNGVLIVAGRCGYCM